MKYVRSFLTCLLIAALLCLCACKDPTPPADPANPDPIDSFAMLLTDPERASVSYGDFTVNTAVQNGITRDGDVYTITKGGEYTLSGTLNGCIVVNVPKEEKVKLILNGVHIRSEAGAPISAYSADELTVKAETNTYNVVEDTRPYALSAQEDAAVYAKDDLTFSGRGILILSSQSGRGVHSSNDVTFKNITLKIDAADTAVKGNDSVCVESGDLLLISRTEDGIKTEHTDVSDKGKQRGDVTFAGGCVNLYTYADAVQAAHDVILQSSAFVTAYTGRYSAYPPTDTCIEDATGSAKGIKAENRLLVTGGALDILASDDAVKLNRGTFLENGSTSLGSMSVTGGRVRLRTDCDALDITGDLSVSGGYLVLEVLTKDDASAAALKVAGTCEVTGGTLLAFGGLEASDVLSALSPSAPLSAGLYALVDEHGEPCTYVTLKAEHTACALLCPSLADGTYTLTKEDATVLTVTLTSGVAQ